MARRRPLYDVGDIIEYAGVPVLVIGRPTIGLGGGWYARAVFLRGRQGLNAVVGNEVVRFSLSRKKLYIGELTDEEHALAMKILLIGPNK